MLLHIVVYARPGAPDGRSRGPDVVKRFGVLHTVPEAQFAIGSQHELPDVVAVSRSVVVSEQRQPLSFPREFCPQLRPVMSAWSLGDVADVGVDFRADGAADLHYAVD